MTSEQQTWVVVGEGRRARFYLTHWHRSSNAPDMPRFARGAAGRTKAMRFQNKLEADRAASHANDVDTYGIEWHPIMVAGRPSRDEATIMECFASLSSQLSPENLHCDGEISPAEAARKEVHLRATWACLERELGRTVTEHDLMKWWSHNRHRVVGQQ